MLNEYNFDGPEAFDTDCIVYTLERLKLGKSVDIPIYNFSTHRVEKQKVMMLTV
jgi:uridine kinase